MGCMLLRLRRVPMAALPTSRASLQNHTSIGARGARFGTFGLRKALSALAGNRCGREVTGCSRTSYVRSGRPGSNRRRPAWEADILPLNYARALSINYLQIHPDRKVSEIRVPTRHCVWSRRRHHPQPMASSYNRCRFRPMIFSISSSEWPRWAKPSHTTSMRRGPFSSSMK